MAAKKKASKKKASKKKVLAKKPDPYFNWDPPKNEREYFRHADTGDLGYLVRREGKHYIRYDRGPDVEYVRPYNENDWVSEEDHREFSDAQIVLIAFEADKQLCRLLGMHDKTRRDWPSLTAVQRHKWIEEGPRNNHYRVALYRAIKEAMEGFG
jgi:hypothetical protein